MKVGCSKDVFFCPRRSTPRGQVPHWAFTTSISLKTISTLLYPWRVLLIGSFKLRLQQFIHLFQLRSPLSGHYMLEILNYFPSTMNWSSNFEVHMCTSKRKKNVHVHQCILRALHVQFRILLFKAIVFLALYLVDICLGRSTKR